ncbi:tripartite tricarboxylate transporter substrate binding protein [Bosea sp. BK604]|uniref:tripartite tricarboxylate transporter substrate binding protein n=1 Tax=Bosea sp. BK604 TaxID=2512180 RepID=UPI00104540E3|nr:tripartite tricarboxylate transporter substrate binding protein [Bosea sp. BK604]TCR68617.1 putative tricarboxylic transport membrane protein [Bosea sp. BK604]
MKRFLAALTLVCAAAAAQAAELTSLEIIAPAGPGGGYDQLARAAQSTLMEERLATSIVVSNRPGAGGTLGLAEFVNKNKAGVNLIATGIGMVGSIVTSKSPVRMDQTRPLALMTGEYLTIVVAKNSPIKNMADFAEAYKKNPATLSLGGFAAGGSDHLLYGSVVQSFNGDISKMNYVVMGAGGEMLAQVMGGNISTGAGGYNEFAGQIKSGTLRAIGIAAPARLPGIDVPTMKEQGFDVDLVNWRGFLAPAGISDTDRVRLDKALGEMVKSERWQKLLADRGWVDLYMPSDTFADFLANEDRKVTGTLKSLKLID